MQRSARTQMFLSILVVVVILVIQVRGQCPWNKNLTELHASCTCSFVSSKLAVQCSSVNVTRLLGALRDNTGTDGSSPSPPIDSLQVTNSSLPILADDAFYNLRVTTLHIGGCGLRKISANALRDLEDSLLTLNLPDNELANDALTPLRKIRTLTTLDVSQNRISNLGDDGFKGLSLDTLNLMENNITSISDKAFNGLEKSLKNLNMKGTGQNALPEALRNLTALAFLDLAQNSIQDLGSAFFEKMDSLTALSLERNQLRQLQPDALRGLEDTMSSLSLLNNQFQEIPIVSVSILKELRVLDLGFNQISMVPLDAFKNSTSLTLLALDGNPLSTLPFAAFQHLQSTLRGLSVGGRSLVCDCNIRWIAEWVREYDLQVTSRERNPQFCGHPAAQRNKNLYLLRPAQLVCPETTTSEATTTTKINNSTNQTTSQAPLTTTLTPVTTSSIGRQVNTSNPPTTLFPELSNSTTVGVTTTTNKSNPTATASLRPIKNTTTTVTTEPSTVAASNDSAKTSSINSPFLVRSPHNQRSARKEQGQYIKIREAFREDFTIVITWEISTINVPGFRVVYRTFGDSIFKEGAVLPLRVRKFRMTNVPPTECLVVCVISLAETGNLTVDSIPSANCREMRSEHLQTAGNSDIDKIVIIIASSAICIAIIIAVFIFVCCQRRRRCRHHEKQPPSLAPPIIGLPPMEPSKPEWDNASAYSSRSIPRARMYHMGRAGGTVNSAFLPDEARSHLSHMSTKHHGDDRTQSLIDGQYGPYGGGVHTNTLPNPYPLGRPDTNRSSKSLAQMSYHDTNRKKRPQRNGKWSSISNNGSMHSLAGYNAENGYFHPNPWSNSDMDHYPTGNHVSQPFSKRDYT